MAVRPAVAEGDLQSALREKTEELEVPGVAAGIYHEGKEHYAFDGVTSIENPLPVDEATLFQFGSTGKTFTATAIMRLVEAGKVDLKERVRKYIPELRLKDKDVAEHVTVLQLLNHTAGWTGDASEETGDGDDALAKFVEKMPQFDQTTPLGSAVSYNNAAVSLAGRLIEKVTGKVFEQAMKELILEPLRLENVHYFMKEIMTRRFAVGHIQHPDGSITVARPWPLPRAGAPAGGSALSSNAGDQIKWARFHLGDGRGPDGTQILSRDSLQLMKQPSIEAKGSALGDYVGISWLIEDVDGIRLVGHGGSTRGQLSSFVMVPDRDFAVAVLTNCSPNGAHLHKEMTRWALEAYLDVIQRDPDPITLSDEELAPYLGTFETVAATLTISAENGGLLGKVDVKPEYLEELRAAGEEVPDDEPPLPIGLLPGGEDRYVITGGRGKGLKGYFVRNDSGAVVGVHIGGRLATRIAGKADVAGADKRRD